VPPIGISLNINAVGFQKFLQITLNVLAKALLLTKLAKPPPNRSEIETMKPEAQVYRIRAKL
jgi:hypothetical protein